MLAEEERDQHKLDRKIVAEEHWLRYGVTARRKRNMRRVGELQALREQRRTHRASAGSAAITASAAEPSGALVIEAKGIGKSYEGRADRAATSRPASSAATASASSGRTAAARPRWSTC